MRRLLLGCCTVLLFTEGLAAADAHHQVLSHAAIHDQSGEVIGFKAQVLLDPQRLTQNHATFGGDVRLALGGLKFDRAKAVPGNPNYHRDAVAGVVPGYVLHQLKMREITGPNPADRGALVETLQTGGALKEVEVEVHYKDNPNLIPGSHVDLVAGFWKGSYWHVWGAADSPTTSSRDFVVQLPGTPSKAFLTAQLHALEASLPKAQADAKAALQQHDVAQQAHATANQAYQAMHAQRQAPSVALQQTNQAAQVAYQQATQAPQAAYNSAVNAARLAYQNTVAAPNAAYQAAVNTAQVNLRNGVGGVSANQLYNQASQAARMTLHTHTQQAFTAQQQAITQANATLQAATTAARATLTQATQAAHAAYQATLATTQANHTTITQQFSTASSSYQTATATKNNADATLKSITDKIADYQKMLAGLTTVATAQ